MSGLKVDELLKEMQAFFHGYSQLVPNPKSDDKPYRTAKTILFHLTEQMGNDVSVWGCEGMCGWVSGWGECVCE